jgi:hypothetical protein
MSIPTARNNTYSSLNGTRVYFTEPNTSYITMCIDYKDESGNTVSVTNNWTYIDNLTVMNTSTFSPGTSLVTQCYTIKNVKGTRIWWGYNATRSVG